MSHVTRESLLEQYRTVRQASLEMVKPLQPEEFRIQPIEEVSPPWWNLGHTSWFFARNIIAAYGAPYLPEDEKLDYVLNSYYVALGPRLQRNRRGLITRPTTEEILRYRELVDTRVETLIQAVPEKGLEEFARILTLGMHHEQQHQELFYTEIKFILAENPVHLRPAYQAVPHQPGGAGPERGSEFVPFEGGLLEFGNLEEGWCWDNELPVHKCYLRDFALQNLLVTNGEIWSSWRIAVTKNHCCGSPTDGSRLRRSNGMPRSTGRAWMTSGRSGRWEGCASWTLKSRSAT
jgi:DinB superfamily